ncbi:MAG: hypothetical protein J5I92_06705 [Thiogranum sp.]|nr:hypothetical protein [Thiogranum sp.]
MRSSRACRKTSAIAEYQTMHEIRLTDIRDDRQLSLAVVQIGQMLGFYNAEVARILGVKCGDIGALSDGREVIQAGSDAGRRAHALVRFYEALFDHHNGDEVAMHHWLRRDNRHLNGQPLLLLVDDNRIDELVRHLESANTHGRGER